MEPVFLSGRTTANPGNGFFRLRFPEGFSTITISQPNPSVALTGVLTFTSGAHAAQINLASDRFLSLAGPVPFLDVDISGVDAAAEFSIVLA